MQKATESQKFSPRFTDVPDAVSPGRRSTMESLIRKHFGNKINAGHTVPFAMKKGPKGSGVNRKRQEQNKGVIREMQKHFKARKQLATGNYLKKLHFNEFITTSHPLSKLQCDGQVTKDQIIVIQIQDKDLPSATVYCNLNKERATTALLGTSTLLSKLQNAKKKRKQQLLLSRERCSTHEKLLSLRKYGIVVAGELALIHIRDGLTEDGVKGKKLAALLHLLQDTAGWMKCCSAAGCIDIKCLERALSIPTILAAWGLHDFGTLIDVELSGTGGSGKINYFNKDGKRKSFQVGNWLDRKVYEPKNNCSARDQLLAIAVDFQDFFEQHYNTSPPEVFSRINSYFDDMERIFRNHAYAMADEETRRLMHHHGPEVWCDRLFIANNLVDQSTSRIAFHQDPSKSHRLPHVLTCTNPAKEFCHWKGGRLVFVPGSFCIDYSGDHDVVLLNGKFMHGVEGLHPPFEKGRPIRMSMVMFSRFDATKTTK